MTTFLINHLIAACRKHRQSQQKPPFYTTTSIHTTTYHRSATMADMARVDALISSITSLDMINEDTIQKFWATEKERIVLPNVKVSSTLFLAYIFFLPTNYLDHPCRAR